MKLGGRKKKIILMVRGKKLTFLEEEITDIVEEYFSVIPTENDETMIVSKVPTVNKWFEVKPKSIARELFKEKRKDRFQEEVRELILSAFTQVDNKPEIYSSNFKTMFPKRLWKYKTVADLNKIAATLGNHNADWVEQALEWAQRISNGEEWKTICNSHDTAKWYRVVMWKDGSARLIGGSYRDNCFITATDVSEYRYALNTIPPDAVPLVVSYK